MPLRIDDLEKDSIITVNSIKQKETKGFDDENTQGYEQKSPIAGLPIVICGVNVPFISGFLYGRNSQNQVVSQPIVLDSRDYVLQRLNDINYIKYFGVPVSLEEGTDRVKLRGKPPVAKPKEQNSIVGMKEKVAVK